MRHVEASVFMAYSFDKGFDRFNSIRRIDR